MARDETQRVGQAPAAAAPDAPDPDVAGGHPLGNDPRLSPGHVHAVDPGHGEPVTFQPGELLPAWVLDQFVAGATLAVEGPGVFRLVTVKAGKR
jgi:hypothetical protein